MMSPLFMRRITRVPSDMVVPESMVAVQDKVGAWAEAAEATASNNPATSMVMPPDLVMIFPWFGVMKCRNAQCAGCGVPQLRCASSARSLR